MKRSSTKLRSLFPLPGGGKRYFYTLVDLLTLVEKGEGTSIEELMEGFKARKNQLALMSQMGLWSEGERGICLTEEGKALLNMSGQDPQGAKGHLYQLMIQTYEGLEETRDYLSGGARTVQEVHAYLLEKLSVNWKSLDQVMARLNWLKCLGVAKAVGKKVAVDPSFGGGTRPRVVLHESAPPEAMKALQTLLLENQDLLDSIRALEDERQGYLRDMEHFEGERQLYVRALEALNEDLQEHSRTIEALRAEAQERQRDVEALEGGRQGHLSTIEALEAEGEGLRREGQELGRLAEERLWQSQRLKVEVTDKEDMIGRLRQEKDQILALLEELRVQAEASQSQKAGASEALAVLTREKEQLEASFGEAQTRWGALEAEVSRKEGEIGKLVISLKAEGLARETAEEKVAWLQLQFKQAEESLREKELELQRLLAQAEAERGRQRAALKDDSAQKKLEEAMEVNRKLLAERNVSKNRLSRLEKETAALKLTAKTERQEAETLFQREKKKLLAKVQEATSMAEEAGNLKQELDLAIMTVTEREKRIREMEGEIKRYREEVLASGPPPQTEMAAMGGTPQGKEGERTRKLEKDLRGWFQWSKKLEAQLAEREEAHKKAMEQTMGRAGDLERDLRGWYQQSCKLEGEKEELEKKIKALETALKQKERRSKKT